MKTDNHESVSKDKLTTLEKHDLQLEVTQAMWKVGLDTKSQVFQIHHNFGSDSLSFDTTLPSEV